MDKVKTQHPFRQGGNPKKDSSVSPPQKPAANKSWTPGRQGQGGEGLSDGYGGSGGSGTGPSGPDEKK
jgi:hypothetical protein